LKLNISSAFGQADDILTTAAKGIAEIITWLILMDFKDVRKLYEQ
jgi:cell division protein FtsZ